MTEKKRCIRCDRPIDAAARICPYCNWDQANANVPRPEETAAPVYVPPVERPWRRWIAMGVGGILLVVVAFALGSRVLGTAAAPPASATTTDTGKTSTDTGPVRPAPHPDITLVPTNDTSGASAPIEAPITSAPAATASTGTAAETDRTDATAVSSAEYAQLAARAQAEKKKQQAIVDPRSITGPAYQEGQQPKKPQQPAEQQPQISSARETPAPAPAAARTPADPQYQPMPDVQVNQMTTVRLTLTVGADGRVKEVDIGGQGIEGQTSKIIATVQTWRFKPATENGQPVQSTFSTALTFHPNP